ncbi:MAG TPA: transglutaminase-like domain-containing protein [Ktedonosporobacter sp.]|nr:transglutaminase-like domain-containing protein [Ktedonosporobacter sp.]
MSLEKRIDEQLTRRAFLWLNARSMAERFPKDTAQQRTYRAFETLIAREDASIDLAQAALLIASIEYPDLDMAQYLLHLDALARRVQAILALPPPEILAELPPESKPLKVIAAMNKVLFEEEGFQGNKADYYNPNNSFFNKVLDNRTGIPITLSLLYMEVGKRVGIQIDGIALPYHFMVRCHLPEGPIYIDAFEGGTQMSERECRERIRHLTHSRTKLSAHWFEPVNPKIFLARMLNNLKKCYLEQEDYVRMLAISDLIIILVPHFPSEWRDRGIVHMQLQHYSRALQDLLTYLDLAPKANDRSEILNHIKTIRQIMAMMN